ncbi:conserved hypothetical protein [Planktothrix sp. PCC 11201]|uniref:glycosyltransferase family 61 protein n=1 Tax=Planktothrix sp. PCC 11201 TaxID=1729650 RepID=UPI00091F1A84|nr:glycosyltransferase family 61 protein [Planktothrix sp. PCC 11201]SKB16032.1 conserved hypothetical protein [Planktothrix sp. PCC 11201]
MKFADFWKPIQFQLNSRLSNWLVYLMGFWRKSLDHQATSQLLKDNIVYQQQQEPISDFVFESVDRRRTIPWNSLNNLDQLYQDDIIFEPEYVWKVDVNDKFKTLNLCPSGTVLVNQNLLLDLDYGTAAGLKLKGQFKTKEVEYPLVVAPWSHFFGGYFSFVSLVIVKLCRIEQVFGKEIWRSAKVCYPLFKTQFETEYLQKLGIDQDHLIDTANIDYKIKAKSLIIANNQSNINRVSPSDIQLLRKKFLSPVVNLPKKRIFFPRRSKRVLENETEIRQLLQEFDFEVIEDIPRTVEEQIAIFQQAAVIVGVHGAGLTNLLWCDPGTKVIELFYSGYTKAGFYYFCKVLGLDYSCIFDDAIAIEHFTNQFHNLTINVDTLRKELLRVLT